MKSGDGPDDGAENSERGAAGAPSAESYAADLITIDVVGFSRFTARLVAESGAGAAERVRDVLSAGFRAVIERLRDEGFAPVDSLGDGIVLARRRRVDSSLARLCSESERAFAAATGGLRVRAAGASGDLSLCRLGGWRESWETLATGAAVDAAHSAMQERRRKPDEALVPFAATALRDTSGIDPRLTAEIRRTVVVFVAMRASDATRGIGLATLHEAVLAAQRLAESWGGRLEKVSHDDKGILLNLCFARTRQVGATAADSALDCIIDLKPMLEQMSLSVRFGVADGEIYRGPLVLGDRLISIVHGPTVNRSAKLTSAAVGLAVDETAVEAFAARLGAGVDLMLDDGGKARGFELPTPSGRPRAHPVSRETFGRDDELQMLSRAFGELGAGRGGLVMLAAAPGLGKTRLLHALCERAPADVRTIRVVADPKRASDYMFLWREVLADLARTRADQFSLAMTAHGIPGDLQAIVLDMIPGADFAPSPRIDTLTSGARRDLLERAIAAIVRFAAEREALAIVVDDAHWLDEASCTLLADIAGEAPRALVVLAQRDEAYQHLDRLAASCRAQRISLKPLARAAIDAIVARTKPALAEDEAAREQVFNLSGGNPFHAEQIAFWLNQGGTISERAAKVMQQLVLDERIDGLSRRETRIVRLLSVFDRPLRRRDLERLYGGDGDDKAVAGALATLRANGFVNANGEISMRHRLLGDAVSARIPPSEIASLHAAAARFFAHLRIRERDTNISDAVIAAHWREAGANLRAAVGFGAAGNAALGAGAYRLAIDLFAQAIALAPQGERIATGKIAGWHAGSTAAHWAQGDMVSAVASADHALAILNERMGGPRWLPRSVRRAIARARRTFLAAITRRVVPRAARQPLIILSNARAEMGLYQNSLRTILSANTTMLSLVRDSRLHARGRARGYSFLGHVASLMKLDSLANRAWDRARRAGEQFQDPTASSHGYLGEALWHVSQGRWPAMRAQLAKATELMGGLNDPVYFKFVETLYGLGAYFEGDWEACRERFVAVHRRGVKDQDRSTEAWGLYAQAEALIVPGRLDEATALLDQAQVLVDAMPDMQSEIICAGLRAQLLFLRGARDDALAQAQRCLKLAQALAPVNFGSLEGFAAPAEVSLRLALDETAPTEIRSAAAEMVKPALKVLAKFANVHPIAQPRLELCRAMAERRRGNGAAALRHLNAGLKTAIARPMTFERTKLERELAIVRGSTAATEHADV